MRRGRQTPFSAATVRAHGLCRPLARRAAVRGVAAALAVLMAAGGGADGLAQGWRSRSVTGPCRGVLHWIHTEGEAGWLKRCRAANGGSLTYGGVTHSCAEWSRLCRSDSTYPGHSGARSR